MNICLNMSSQHPLDQRGFEFNLPGWKDEDPFKFGLILNRFVDAICYLHVDEQIQKVFGRHDDGGVERDDIALVQTKIQVSSQPLKRRKNVDE